MSESVTICRSGFVRARHVVGGQAAQPAPYPALPQLICRSPLFVRPAALEEPAAGGGEDEGKPDSLLGKSKDAGVLQLGRGGFHRLHAFLGFQK